jgi:hypothetical protein
VLSVKSGQCIRFVGAIEGKGRIVDFALDPLNEFRLVIAYDTIMISVYDWTDGLLISVSVSMLYVIADA